MSVATLETTPSITPPSTREGVLAATAEVAKSIIRPLAVKVDVEGYYPLESIAALGEAGAFAQHVKGFGVNPEEQDLMLTIEAMATAGVECGNTSFLMWLQNAFAWYLEQTENTALRDELMPDIAAGTLMGTSGMSNPVKSMDEIEDFKLKGEKVEGGWIVNGTLPYVSHLGPDQYIGSAFISKADPSQRVMFAVRINGEDVSLVPGTKFIALDGSGTYSVKFKNAFIAEGNILAEDLKAYVKKIKPAFFLMQGGIALGQIQACVNQMRYFNRTVGHVNQYLPQTPEYFEDKVAEIVPVVAKLLETPTENSPEYMKAMYEARLVAGELTMEAANAALMYAGAKGYIDGSSVFRRFRESVFVAIVTPATKHLRKAIAELG